MYGLSAILRVMLKYGKVYGVANPFDWMEADLATKSWWLR